MLNVLEKHKLIGGKGVTNTLTYLENNTSDFKIGELHNNIIVKDNTLKVNHGEDKILHLDGTLPMTNKGGENITFNVTNGTSASDNSIQLGANKYYTQLITSIVFEKNEDFTLSFDLKWISNTRGWAISGISNDGGNATETTGTFHMVMNDGNVFGNLRLNIDGSSYANTISSVKLNEWVNVSIVRQNNIVSVYYNGEKAFSCACDSKLTLRSGTYIGNWYASHSSLYLNAYMRNFFIVRSALPPLNSGYRLSPVLSTPSSFKGGSVSWEGDGNISIYEDMSQIDENTLFYLNGNDLIDKSPKKVAISSTGASIENNGKFDKCIDFTNGKLTFTLDGSFVNKDFTIDWWEYDYVTTTPTGITSVMTNTLASSNANSFGIGVSDSNLKVRNTFNLASSATAWGIQNMPTGNTLPNQWVHRAVVRKDNIVYAYENGKLFGQSAHITFTTPVANSFQMGRWRDATVSLSKRISEFRISKVARWTSDFEPLSHSYFYIKETPVSKNQKIKELPYKFQLKEEVKDKETISNVRLDVKYGTLNEYKYPVGTDNGEDKELVLYERGQFTNNLGFNRFNAKHYTYDDSQTYLTYNNDHIYFGGAYVIWKLIYSNVKIDLTKYNKVKALVDVTQLTTSSQSASYKSNVGLMVTDATASSTSTVPSAGSLGSHYVYSPNSVSGNTTYPQLTFEVDISNIVGEHYIGFDLSAATHVGTVAKMKIYKIWLEK